MSVVGKHSGSSGRSVRAAVLVLAAAAAGCGRLNFDGSIGTDGSLDDTSNAADPCAPLPTVLADDFDDGSISIGPQGTWASTFATGLTAAETLGRLVVTFPAGSATNATAGVFTERMNLEAACVQLAVPVLPSASTAAYTFMTIEEPVAQNPGRMSFVAASGALEIVKQLSGGAQEVATMRTYDPVAHAWWRLRTGPVVVWETSSDMVAWETLHEETAYFDLSDTQVVIGAATDITSTNAGSAQFDTARIFAP